MTADEADRRMLDRYEEQVRADEGPPVKYEDFLGVLPRQAVISLVPGLRGNDSREEKDMALAYLRFMAMSTSAREPLLVESGGNSGPVFYRVGDAPADLQES